MKNHIAKIVDQKDFVMFWNDDDSVVLQSVSDLTTAIDYAICTRKNATKLACVRLAVVDSEETDSTEVLLKESMTIPTEDDPEKTASTASNPSVDPLIEIKEELLHLIDLVRTEEWTAGLRSIMEPLVCTQTKKLKTVSEISVAEIAVQLALIETKIPEKLKAHLQHISNEEQDDFMESDWWNNEARERAGLSIDDQTLHPLDRLLSPLKIVKLIAMLAEYVKPPKRCVKSDDEDDTDEENETDREMDENEEKILDENKDEDHWDHQAEAILQLSTEKQEIARTYPVYRSAEEFLKQTDAKKEDSPPFIRDREERIKMYLRSLSEDPLEEKSSSIPHEIWQQNCSIWFLQRREQWEKQKQNKSEYPDPIPSPKSHIAELIRITVEDLTEELQNEFQELSPIKLAKIVMMDWVEHINEEKMQATDEEWKSTKCSANILAALLHIGTTATIFPAELREVVKISVKTAREAAKKEKKEEEKDDRMEGSRWVELDDVNAELMDSLNLYLPHWQMYPKWAALIESMNMIDEMKSFINQDQSLIQEEIASEIHHTMKGRSNKTKKFFMKKNASEMAWVLWMHWSCPLEHKKRTKEIMKSNDEHEEPEYLDLSPLSLAARLFNAVADKFNTPTHLAKDFAKFKVRKSTVMAKPIEESKEYDDSMKEWIEKTAAEIVKMGLEIFIPVMKFIDETSQQLQSESSLEEELPTDQQNIDEAITAKEKLDEKENEVKMREKILKMNEEEFERKVAAFEVKMEELEDKLAEIDKRVEESEEKTDTQFMESRMDEIEERLKKIEKKIDENDVEFI